MRLCNSNEHLQDELVANVDVPHAGEVVVFTLKDSIWESKAKINIHIKRKQHNTKINILNPTNSSNSLHYDRRFTDRPGKRATSSNYDLNDNIPQKDHH